MRTEAALRHFGSRRAIAAALGINVSAIYQWRCVVPYASALRLAEISGHRLQLDRKLYSDALKPIRSAAKIAAG